MDMPFLNPHEAGLGVAAPVSARNLGLESVYRTVGVGIEN
jgi:hypothetical protein